MNIIVTSIFVLVAVVALAQNTDACDCDYHPGGCVISQAPAEGSKCKCVYKGAWTCSGFSITCDKDQVCPGDCSSQSCCNTGGGDCGGY